MLSNLIIKRFQSHDYTMLHFHPGVNGIIGRSLYGKTAIIRAIKWLIYNRPSGFKFHSNFASEDSKTAVMVTKRDGTKVTLAKQGTKGTYEVGHIHSDDEPLQFKKIGKNVPDIVKDKLNLTELNIQEQLDSPFLITSSAGEIAKTINKVTQIDDIDKWIKLINRDTTNLNGKKNVLKDDLEDINESLEAFEPLDRVSKKLAKLKKIQRRMAKLEEEYAGIHDLIARIKDTEMTISRHAGYLEAKRKVEEILEIQTELALLENEKSLIKAYKQKLVELQLAEDKKNRLINKYSREIRKQKKCPTCFKPVTLKDVKEIINGLHTTFGHPRHN